MTKKRNVALRSELNHQGAISLLAATFRFLEKNHISKKAIADFTRNYFLTNATSALRNYKKLQSSHEKMGVLMATWFSKPKFLDASGNPIPLTTSGGIGSLEHLIRASGARIKPSLALALMSESPSIKFASDGTLLAMRRVFVLPELEVPRAAFVIERLLDTLQKNAYLRKRKSTLLLERSCHASEVDLSVIAPLLRDIECRGTAFIDSIDSEIEGRRIRRDTKKPIGEMGVLVFAWTRSGNGSRKLPAPTSQ